MTVACHTGLFAGPWLRAAVVALNYCPPCSEPAAPLPAPCRCGRRWNLGGQSRRPALQQINAGDTWPRGLPRRSWWLPAPALGQSPTPLLAAACGVCCCAVAGASSTGSTPPCAASAHQCYRLTFLLYNFEQTAYERLLPPAVGAHLGCGATRARPGVPTL